MREADPVEARHRAVARLPRRRRGEAAHQAVAPQPAEQHVLEHAEIADEVELLEDAADARAQAAAARRRARGPPPPRRS
jgi:hypothetical protein